MLELGDLSANHPATANNDAASDDDGDDDSYAIPSVLLLLVSLMFLFFPSFAFYLASNAEHSVTVTPVERFLLTQLGIYFAVIAASLLLRTARHPLLIPLTLGSSLSAFISYNSTVGSFGTFFFLSQLVLSLWGFYSLLFGNESHKSKATGADKRTSSFIFGNKAAASSQTKEWRKRMKREQR